MTVLSEMSSDKFNQLKQAQMGGMNEAWLECGDDSRWLLTLSRAGTSLVFDFFVDDPFEVVALLEFVGLRATAPIPDSNTHFTYWDLYPVEDLDALMHHMMEREPRVRGGWVSIAVRTGLAVAAAGLVILATTAVANTARWKATGA